MAGKSINNVEILELAKANAIPYENLKAVILVEGAGKGFDPVTGKILIQFEPHWYKRKYDDWQKFVSAQSLWLRNKVGVQSVEWEAFNDAFNEDPNSDEDATAAMESTSIGMMQVMGFHWKLLGFKSVGDMWDYAKQSEKNQVELGLRFIKTNKKMYNALVTGDFATFAYYYNGAEYKKFKYDTRMVAARDLAKKDPVNLA